jgi:hypothetical protein
MKLSFSLTLILILFVTGCAAQSAIFQSAVPAQPGGSPPFKLEQVPPVPAGDPARLASYIEPAALMGITTASDFGNVVYGATSIELQPPAQQLAGAIYAIPVNGFSYSEISFDIDFDDAGKVWLGVGDYQRGCWALTPAYDGITSVAPPYPTAHAPDGNTYFCVLAWDDTTVVVNEVSLIPSFPTWQHHLITDIGEIGSEVDIALIGDYLYVAYGISVDLEVHLARATELLPSETGHWDLSVVTTLDDAVGVDLEEINSLPALVYSEG